MKQVEQNEIENIKRESISCSAPTWVYMRRPTTKPRWSITTRSANRTGWGQSRSH